MAEVEDQRLVRTDTTVDRFSELCLKDATDQAEFFLKSFIFALGDSWKEVPALCSEFTKHAKATGPSDRYMSHIQAADFLQKNDITRTGLERRREIEDIDFNHDGKIVFVEYLLMHYKVMILREFYSRHQKEPEEDLTGTGVGLVGVGDKLLEELFTMPHGLSPQLEAALEEFTADKKKREEKVKTLEDKAAKGGVLGMAAKNELIILNQADTTELNRIELTLNAAKRKAAKQSGEEAVTKAKEAEEKAKKEEHARRRATMKQRASIFEKPK
ncbi:hypothetical protein CTAYLR_008542 [Chrysophaeum taylorii]|uniref:Calcium-regulated actin-bundling protein C-terminal domain-containing protein n=1 Tax=Chrysophaeum taylorii TaxID=2483200 RepID=A0AAD7U5U7_9STRA|nr:hypothetical protein CTAYLR_008542 [Chrysophaeum taylorii]